MLYETTIKNLSIILTATKTGGFKVKTNSATIKRNFNYAFAHLEYRIPKKNDDITFLEKKDFLGFLQKFANEKIKKEKLTSFYKGIFKQSLKTKLLKRINKKEDFDFTNKDDKIYLLLENGNLYLFNSQTLKEYFDFNCDIKTVLSFSFIFKNLEENLLKLFTKEEREELFDTDFIF